jgi:YidC/Oxa1 family membrane protein insertase
LAQEKAKLGEFGYSLDLDSDKDRFTTLENEVLLIKINNKGGMVSEVKLKAFVNHDSVPVYLVKDGNSQFNLNFSTSDNRTFNTTDLYFEPSLSLEENAQVLSMKLKVSERQFLEYKYILNTDDDYMLGFSIQSQGLSKVFDIRQPA